MSDNRRSRAITEGVQRSPNRAIFSAVGFQNNAFIKHAYNDYNLYDTSDVGRIYLLSIFLWLFNYF